MTGSGSGMAVLVAGLCWLGAAQPVAAAERAGCGTALPPSNLQVLDIRTKHVTVTVVPGPAVRRVAVLTHHPLMAIETDVVSWLRVAHRVVRAGSGAYCDAPSEVRFGLGHGRREVHLPWEAAEDACVRGVLLAHEADHNRAVDALLAAFLERERPWLGAGFNALKHTSAKDPDEAAARFEAGAQAIVHEVAERFSTAKERLWRELDSPAELDRLRQACQGKVAQLEARLGGGV